MYKLIGGEMDRIALNIELYRKMFRVRRAEEAIVAEYRNDEMKTPMHMSMGEEGITAALALALAGRHQAFGFYRTHALYISMTDETEHFFAELYGKRTGTVRGKGGSMHLASPEHGLLAASAIVGSTIAPAVGAAFANKYLDNGRVVASFFGDGAMEEGAFSEALNAACLFRLPVLFVCEDNGLAVDVTARQRQGFRSIAAVVGAYECDFFESSAVDPEEILRLAETALKSIRTRGRPAFLHLRYYRFLQHVGVNTDFDEERGEGGFERAGYRSREEHEAWMRKEPVKTQRAKLLALGVPEADVATIERDIDAEVRSSVEKAKAAPLPDESEILDHVLAE